MPELKDLYFTSCTGNRNFAKICLPDSKPRAVVQIVHGIAEHMERYVPFMEFLASNGFVVVGEDHLGHGKSINKLEDRGFFAESDGWNCVLKDIDTLHDLTVKDYPDLPYVFFGHSMGSFLTRNYLILHPDKYSAAIISGTGHQTKPMVLGGLAMAEAAVKLYGPRKIGTTLNNVAFGSYNKGFDHPKTAYDWLTREEKTVEAYIADPLCGFTATVSLFRDMMSGIKFITDPKNIAKMNKEKPIYFMSGAADPVGENGKGVERAYKAFCKAGLMDVRMKLYPEGRHEMLNELNNKDVYQDILNWLNEKI